MRPKKVTVIAAASVAVAVAGTLFWAIETKRAEQRLIAASAELDRITPPASAVVLDRYGWVKLDQVSIGETFSMSSDWEALASHYRNSLQAQGWREVSVRDVLIRGVNYGSKEVYFSKPPYTAILFYRGKTDPKRGWDYTLSVTR